MIRTVLHVLAAVLWSLVVFLVGFHLFFPSKAALERIRWEVDQRSGGEWALEAGAASPWRLTGLAMSDVRLLSVEKKRTPRRSRIRTDEEQPPEITARPVLSLDHLGARLRISSLVRAAPDIGFSADLYGGDVTGHARMLEERTVLAFELNDVDLARISIGGDTWKVDAGGELQMEVDLDLDAKDTRASTGSLKLQVQDLVLRSGTIAGMNLPENTTFTKTALAIELKNGKGSVTEGVIASSLLDATIDGDVTLNKKLTRSRMRLQLTCTLAETFDNLLQLLPTARNARDDEGAYHFVISGTLLSPSIRGNLNRNVRSVRPMGGRLPGLDTRPQPDFRPGFGDQEGDIQDDDRRREREERLKERRDRLKQRREAERRDGGMPEDALDGPRMQRPSDRPDPDRPRMEEPEDRPPEYEEDMGPYEEDERYPEEDLEPQHWPEERYPPMDELDDMPLDGDQSPE